MHTCPRVHSTHAHVHAHAHHTRTHVHNIHTCTHTHMHTHTCAPVHTCHTHAHTCTQHTTHGTHMHTWTHTCAHSTHMMRARTHALSEGGALDRGRRTAGGQWRAANARAAAQTPGPCAPPPGFALTPRCPRSASGSRSPSCPQSC